MKQKGDIIATVSKETGLSLKETKETVNTFIEAITKELEAGETVRFSGFGTFGVKETAPTKARNFSSGELVDVPERKIPFFKAGDALKRRVRSS